MVIEEFYKTFGIETQEKSYCSKGYCIRKPSAIKFSDCKICRNCEKGHFYIVPEITNRILLELICLHSQYDSFLLTREKFETLKNHILLRIITLYKSNWVSDKNKFKKQIQNLLGE